MARVLQQGVGTEGEALIFVRTLAGTLEPPREIWGSPMQSRKAGRVRPSMASTLCARFDSLILLQCSLHKILCEAVCSARKAPKKSADWASGKSQCISTADSHCYLTHRQFLCGPKSRQLQCLFEVNAYMCRLDALQCV